VNNMQRLRCFIALKIAFLFILTFSPAHATDPGTTYRVVNVSENDPLGLNVRQIIGDVHDLSEAKIVENLKWNARGIISTGLEYQFAGALWRQIMVGDTSGWVNVKYLAVDGSGANSGRLPDKIRCEGTEPFWGLTINKINSLYQGNDWSGDKWLGGEKMELLVSHRLANRNTNTWAVTLKRSSAPQYIRTLISLAPQSCSDGMSKFSYPYHAVFLQGKTPVPQQGCCHVDVGN